MTDRSEYEKRREVLRMKYLDKVSATDVSTTGVDHLALICSDMYATIGFYIEVLKMLLSY